MPSNASISGRPAHDTRPVAILLGLLAAAVPTSLRLALPQQTIDAAGQQSRPLIALILAAPLLIPMLVVTLTDWRRGNRSPAQVVGQIAALVLVLGSVFLVVLTVGDYYLMSLLLSASVVGFTLGLSATFIAGRDAAYTDAALADFGWGAFAVIIFVQVVVATFTAQPAPATHGFSISADGISYFLELTCSFTFLMALLISVTIVPLGGVVGGWLRRGGER